MYREGKPEGFFYLEHRTVDSKCNIVTDVHVTPGNVNDVEPYIERLDRQIKRFGFDVKYVGLDAGYLTNLICKQIIQRNLQGVIGFRLGPHEKNKYTKYKFQYVKEWDVYVCPNMFFLRYRTTDKNGYKSYSSVPKDCANCSHKELCLIGKNNNRTIRRHVWEEFKENVVRFTRSDKGKTIYKRRKETVERSFADAKELHGLRYCRMRGKAKVSEQCLLTAAVQNMKKIAMVLFSHGFQYFMKIGSIYCQLYRIQLAINKLSIKITITQIGNSGLCQ